MEGGSDRRRAGHVLIDVFIPRLAGISQSGADISFDPLIQIVDLGVRDGIRELAHIPLQGLIHQLEAANQKFLMMTGEREVEPFVGAPNWVDDEVGKGFVE